MDNALAEVDKIQNHISLNGISDELNEQERKAHLELEKYLSSRE